MSVEGAKRCGLPVAVGVELLHNVTALYQNGYIVRGEKDFMTESVQNGMRTGDYSPLYEYVMIKIPTAAADNPFYGRMKELMEQEE